MHFIYLQQSGKPVTDSSGNFWVIAGVGLPAEKWKSLQLRLNGLQKSFQKQNYDPLKSAVDCNDVLHPRNAEKGWTRAFCKGFGKIVMGLDAKFFLVVVDKRTTDKPAHPRWLLPLTYHYLIRPISQYLREANDMGALVIPPGRADEAEVIAQIQVENLFGHQGRTSPLIASPLIQSPPNACGLQIADFVATVTRRYHETIYPKLYAKQTLYGYDALINSQYQGFVKPGTYQSTVSDYRGYKIRGYIYLWRRDGRPSGGADSSSGEVDLRDLSRDSDCGTFSTEGSSSSRSSAKAPFES